MTKSYKNTITSFMRLGILLAVAGCATGEVPHGASGAKPPSEAAFSTPDDAVKALINASRAEDHVLLLKILGPLGEKLIHSGDKVADNISRERFLAAYDKSHELQSQGEGKKILVVGDEDWPMPIPLVHGSEGWWFDTDAGDDEILNRRIGRNELSVIEVCRAYVDAQREYSAINSTDDRKRDYAERFLSTSGKHDGLYWPATEGQPLSPLGPLIATATAEGYKEKAIGKHLPYHGYYYKILKAQGSHASSGARDYMKDGHMSGGFALVAFPARYNDSGVMTFVVNHNGIVYQKNLGPNTSKIAAKMTSYDPDESWSVVP